MTNISNQTDYYLLNFSTKSVNEMKAFASFRIILAIISLIFLSIGILGNTVSFIVFNNKSTRTLTDLLLSSYCISSSLALLGLLINQILYGLFFYYQYSVGLSIIMKIYPYTYPITATFQMSCIWLTVAVSTVQFITVWTKRSRSNLNQKLSSKVWTQALHIVVIIYIFSSVYCIPYWLIFQYNDEKELFQTDFGKSEIYNKIVYFWMYLPCVYLGPLVILLITNSYLVSTIIISNKRKQIMRIRLPLRRNPPPSGSSLIESKMETENFIKLQRVQKVLNRKRLVARKTQIMLIAHIIFFFACQFPNLNLHILKSFDFTIDHYYMEISKFLLIFNLSFNFAIYYLFSEKFRNIFKEKFRKN